MQTTFQKFLVIGWRHLPLGLFLIAIWLSAFAFGGAGGEVPVLPVFAH